MCYLNMGLNYFKLAPRYYMTLNAESAADQTDHSVHAFVRKNVVHGYDNVMTFEGVRKRIFKVLTAFSVRIWLE